jgi:hypothetical protein
MGKHRGPYELDECERYDCAHCALRATGRHRRPTTGSDLFWSELGKVGTAWAITSN